MKALCLLARPVAILLLLTGHTFAQPAKQVAAGTDRLIDYFEVHDADVRSVFSQLSSFSGTDIVCGENVKGTVSVSVSNKSWREIMSIVCRVNNLAAVNEGTYVYVLTADDYNKRSLDNATAVQMTQDVSPLKRQVIKLAHTKATELQPSIQGLLSVRGKITVVEHTNAIIIFDTEDNIQQIRTMIQQLDIETAQISISCKIVEVSSGVMQSMGIHWGYVDGQANVTAQHLDPANIVAGAIEKVTYGVLSASKFSAALEYLFEDNKAEIVAQPQITTLDNKEARIFMGQQIPVTHKDIAGNTIIQMINAGTQLTVTPHISGEGRIMLTLNPKKESFTQSQSGPIINEQSAMTNVVVNNGETVVIAGLTSNEERKTEAGIPFLKDIPLFGNLFKRSNKSVDKKDLIIFVTPHILQRNLDAALVPPAETPGSTAAK